MAINVEDFIDYLDENFVEKEQLHVSTREDGTTIIFGPMGTMMFAINNAESHYGFSISALADPCAIGSFMYNMDVWDEEFVCYGPYIEDYSGQGIHMDPDAIQGQKLVYMAEEVVRMGKQIEDDKPAIIVPDRQIVVAK